MQVATGFSKIAHHYLNEEVSLIPSKSYIRRQAKLLSVGPEVQILSGTPANNAESLCFPGLSAFLVGKHEKAPYCYGASMCQKASALLYRECRGEHCSPAAISGNVRFHGSIWNAPLRRRGGFYIRPGSWAVKQSITGAHCAPLQEFFKKPFFPS